MGVSLKSTDFKLQKMHEIGHLLLKTVTSVKNECYIIYITHAVIVMQYNTLKLVYIKMVIFSEPQAD